MEIERAEKIFKEYLTEHLTDPDAKDLCDAIKTMLIFKKEIDWIHRDIPGMRFDEIEKALGFKLFIWQKTYITRGEWRQMGTSTAQSIRRLLQVDKPLKLYANVFPRERIENQITWRICQQLHNAGIETCKVITNCY